MKKILFILGCLFISSIVSSFATPPASITLSYDLDNPSLHVEAVHPSFNVTRSYVRMMVVSLNGQEVNTLNYTSQNTPNKFWDDVPLKAQVGDTIDVVLYCTEGGSLSQKLTVTLPGKMQPEGIQPEV